MPVVPVRVASRRAMRVTRVQYSTVRYGTDRKCLAAYIIDIRPAEFGTRICSGCGGTVSFMRLRSSYAMNPWASLLKYAPSMISRPSCATSGHVSLYPILRPAACIWICLRIPACARTTITRRRRFIPSNVLGPVSGSPAAVQVLSGRSG